MNIFIIIGILIIAIGTSIMGYGLSIIAGVLLTALGTGFMVYGQLVKSKVDNAEAAQVLQDKVDSVLRHIEEVREGEKGESSAIQIHQIEDEFKTWAGEFLNDRERKKVELARSALDLVEMQLKVSNEWRPVFEYVINTIESFSTAYTAQSGEIIKVIFPSIPANLYSEEASNYNGQVLFPNRAIWRIRFSSSKPPKENNPPSMVINFTTDMERNFPDYSNSLFIHKFGKPGDNSINVHVDGSDIPMTEDVEGIYPFDSYRDSLKKIILALFEAQLLRD